LIEGLSGLKPQSFCGVYGRPEGRSPFKDQT
jgi:hypothetical protein